MKSSDGSRSLTAAAVSGGVWTALQGVANRLISFAGAIATTYFLSPDALGVASIALGVQAFVTVLQPFTFGDVLLSDPRRLHRDAIRTFWMCMAVSFATFVVGVSISPAISNWYGDDRLRTACMVVALRPIAEALLMLPQTRLRVALQFKLMSLIDGSCFAGATILSVIMAWAGGGFMSLVVPQVLAAFIRAGLYQTIQTRCAVSEQSGDDNGTPSVVSWRNFLLSGLGQYVHGTLIFVTPPIIGIYCSERAAGLFTMAFSLAASVNGIVAVAMGLVLQPIFTQMGSDRNRQSAAFLRASSAIAAIAMPLSLVQALVVPAAFRLFLPVAWFPAAAMAQVLSIGQGFYFAVNPAMGLLKAQGRFATFMVWQAIQFAAVVTLMITAGTFQDGIDPSWIVAIASLYHVVSSPIGVWICVRGERSMGDAAGVFLPNIIACAVGGGIAIGGDALMTKLFPALPHRIYDLAVLVFTPVLVILVFVTVIRIISPRTWLDLRQIARTISGNLRLHR
jgi:O-antigen/teichoic acid export membrane protein